MIKDLIRSIMRENVATSDEDLMADNTDTSIRDAFIGEDGEFDDTSDVTDAKIRDLIKNLPESNSNLTLDEISELSESYLDVFEDADYALESSVSIDSKIRKNEQVIESLTYRDSLTEAEHKQLGEAKRRLSVLTMVKENQSEDFDMETLEESNTIDITMEDTDELALEGTTVESIKIGLSDDKKKADEEFKKAKKAIKNGKNSEAIKHIDNAKKIYEKLEKDLNKLDESTASSICSLLLVGFPLSDIYALMMGKGGSAAEKINIGSYVLSLSTASLLKSLGVPFVGNAGMMTAQVISTVEDDYKIRNITKAKTIKVMKEAIKQCDELKKAIKASGKENVKESFIIDGEDVFLEESYFEEDDSMIFDVMEGYKKDIDTEEDENIKDGGKKADKPEGKKDDNKETDNLDEEVQAKESFIIDGKEVLFEENLYADDQPVHDRYNPKSDGSAGVSSKDKYADDQWINDVGVDESEELDLTDDFF